MEIKVGTDVKTLDMVNLSLLAIDTAEEIARFNKGLETNFQNANEFSDLMLLKRFTDSLDYKSIFSKAYSETYPEKNSEEILAHSKEYILDTYQKLKSPKDLNEEDLLKLKDFCVNYSNHYSSYKEWIESLKGPCFR